MAALKLLKPVIGVALMIILCLEGVFCDIECEHLQVEACAFSVASSGIRCVLEKFTVNHKVEYKCLSSMVMAERQSEWIQRDECMIACGLERMSVGMSTDGFLDSNFTLKLCSTNCHNNCPNIIDLYTNLAAGEGIYLPVLCKAERIRARSLMSATLASAKFSRINQSFEARAPGSI